MINFVPKPFIAGEDTCPTCIARAGLEESLEAEQAALSKISSRFLSTGAPTDEIASTYRSLSDLFYTMLSNYRVSFAVNMAIWFSAERFGRAKKVPDLLLAYDEYRREAGQSCDEYHKVCERFLAACEEGLQGSSIQEDLDGLASSHKALTAAISSFWSEVDSWTNRRRDEAFKVL